MYNGQVQQDCFVLHSLKHKRNGTYVEIGSRDHKYINNTYLLETEYGWRGFMVEYDTSFLPSYIINRPNSYHLMLDATTINFKQEFEQRNFPKNIDYLQIDLEADNRSTLTTLEHLDSQVMGEYKFAVVTFEHDIYRGDFFNTRNVSRDIFQKNGYIRVFSDVSNFEDWYVHPDLVDMDYINRIKRDTSMDWKDIINIVKSEYV